MRGSVAKAINANDQTPRETLDTEEGNPAQRSTPLLMPSIYRTFASPNVRWMTGKDWLIDQVRRALLSGVVIFLATLARRTQQKKLLTAS